MLEVATKGFLKTTVTAEHRTGFCEKCGTQTVKEFYMDGERQRIRMVCPACGGLGVLIAKTYSTQPPDPPQCLNLKCLWHFFLDTLFCALLSNYHRRRVAYAEAIGIRRYLSDTGLVNPHLKPFGKLYTLISNWDVLCVGNTIQTHYF